MRQLTLILALVVLGACGGAAQTTSQTSPAPCITSGVASQSWPLPQPAPSSSPPIVSATVSGDTLTLTFTSGTPEFQVITQSSAVFPKIPSGDRLSLAGTFGARIVLTGFRGDQANFSGPKTLMSSGPLLLEVAEVGDFEGSVSFGVGLSDTSCANVASSGSTLTFLFVRDD